MSYIRVLPRDLFNEASLLKCLGRLWIRLDHGGHSALFEDEDLPAFDIEQDPSSGAIYVANLSFRVGGQPCRLTRPLNSRRPWPLYAEVEGADAVEVFDDQGNLTSDMVALVWPP